MRYARVRGILEFFLMRDPAGEEARAIDCYCRFREALAAGVAGRVVRGVGSGGWREVWLQEGVAGTTQENVRI